MIITRHISPYVTVIRQQGDPLPSWLSPPTPENRSCKMSMKIEYLRRHAHGHPLSDEDEAFNTALNELQAALDGRPSHG
ncbi:hypothetical protein RGQ15_13725 [Paracoccus sp. MBLB3053]|uniref:Uncharacterized protein n=1 Tax=Paracoccus aurantius TaxID=3073814 RepID=A0ABU2HVJ0_9RHOB|nr:hypothetical protein [Paracoccus sp. MBLB3053]MDS9468624.1 hypothetical protein [Paracoccus sp. MBLB3053]